MRKAGRQESRQVFILSSASPWQETDWELIALMFSELWWIIIFFFPEWKVLGTSNKTTTYYCIQPPIFLRLSLECKSHGLTQLSCFFLIVLKNSFEEDLVLNTLKAYTNFCVLFAELNRSIVQLWILYTV